MIEAIIAGLLAILGPASTADLEPADRESVVAIIGDSLTAEHLDQIEDEAACAPLVINAMGGRRITEGREVFGVWTPSGLDALASLPVRPATVIVELGTNDVEHIDSPAEAADLVSSMLAAVGQSRVVWVTVAHPHHPVRSTWLNDAIALSGVEMILWHETVRPELLRDAVHLNEAGASAMADLYCEAMR